MSAPYAAETEALREVILGADPAITEGIKWNVPSFRTSDWFATLHLRGRDGIQVILHFGAKKRATPIGRAAVPDPDGLLAWLGGDRAAAKFRDVSDVAATRAAFQHLIRAWLAHL